MDIFLGRLSCGHPNKQELNPWKFKLDSLLGRLSCEHPCKQGLHPCRVKLDILLGRLSGGHAPLQIRPAKQVKKRLFWYLPFA